VWSLSQNTATSTTRARRGIVPDLGMDAGEVDPLVEPMADRFIAGVGDEVWEAADLPVVTRFRAE
jgi:hypothetical protein